jgi:hypothetical protein
MYGIGYKCMAKIVEQNVLHTLKIAHRGYVIENGRIVIEDTGEALTKTLTSAPRIWEFTDVGQIASWRESSNDRAADDIYSP